jgi:hypothetical protein
MSRNTTIAVVVGAIAVAILGGWFAIRMLGNVSEADYADRFAKGCQEGVRQSLMKAGRPAAEAQSQAEQHCACALQVVAPLPMADKIEAEKPGSERARQIAGAIYDKCAPKLSDSEYAANFTRSCQDSARQSLVTEGKPAPEAQSRAEAYCTCALGIVAPMSPADKRELDLGSGERAQQISAEIRTKCPK